MAILSIILGIILAICGVALMFTPLLTFMEAGYFLAILLLVYGLVGIIAAIARKRYSIRFLMSLIAAALGLVVLLVPGLKAVVDGAAVYLMAIFFLILGIGTIYLACRTKKLHKKRKSNTWIWTLILGILEVILAVYSFVHPTLLAVTIGVLIGLYFLVTGIGMIVLSGEIED